MELKGKKMCFLGDSITQGVGASSPEKVYWQVFAHNTGAIVQANGIGGTRYARQAGVEEYTWGEKYFALRVEELDADADVVVVFGGTNDFGHGNAPLGTMADRTVDTFYGALHSLYVKLLTRFPAAEIVIMTPLHCGGENNPLNGVKLRNVATLSRYVEAIKEVAAYYGLPLLDLYAMSGLTTAVPAIRETYLPDWLHPSDAGYARIASRLEGFLRTL